MEKTILWVIALILILISATAVAETGDNVQITGILCQAGITEPVQLSQWGDTAACFVETDGVKRLVLLERHDGAWQIVIDNPTALIQDADWPELYLDSDISIYWTYILSDQEVLRYHSSRGPENVWGPVDQYYGDSGYGEHTYSWTTMWDDAHGGESESSRPPAPAGAGRQAQPLPGQVLHRDSGWRHGSRRRLDTGDIRRLEQLGSWIHDEALPDLRAIRQCAAA